MATRAIVKVLRSRRPLTSPLPRNRKPMPRTVAMSLGPDLRPQPRDVLVEGAPGTDHVVCQTSRSSCSLVTTLPGVGHQPGQQVELLGRQRASSSWSRNALARPGRRAGRRQPLSSLRLGPPGSSPYPGQQLGQPERLGDVVVGSRVEAVNRVHLLGARGQQQDLQPGSRSARSRRQTSRPSMNGRPTSRMTSATCGASCQRQDRPARRRAERDVVALPGRGLAPVGALIASSSSTSSTPRVAMRRWWQPAAGRSNLGRTLTRS